MLVASCRSRWGSSGPFRAENRAGYRRAPVPPTPPTSMKNLSTVRRALPSLCASGGPVLLPGLDSVHHRPLSARDSSVQPSHQLPSRLSSRAGRCAEAFRMVVQTVPSLLHFASDIICNISRKVCIHPPCTPRFPFGRHVACPTLDCLD